MYLIVDFTGYYPAGSSFAVDGTDILATTPYKRARWGIRRTFQTEQVVNELTVHDNVSVMLDTLRLSSSAKAASIERALEFTGLARHADRGAPLWRVVGVLEEVVFASDVTG